MALSAWLHGACAAFYLLLALAVPLGIRPGRTGIALAASALATAAWAAAAASGLAGVAGILELAQLGAWYGFVLHLYRRAVPNGSGLGRLLSGLGLAAILLAAVSLAAAGTPWGMLGAMLASPARLGLAVCTILLIENLYRNAAEDLRWHVTLPCVALGGLFIYDIVLYSDAMLFGRISPVLADGRSVLMALLAPLLGISALRNGRRWGATLQVSHQAVFYSASLVVTGVFLLALAATGEVLRQTAPERHGDWATVVEISLIFGGMLAAAVFATSGSARSTLRNLLVNNFLAHRYDYRVEWLRCIQTLTRTDTDTALHTRAIKAVAQIVDSPAGMVFVREAENGAFGWAGSWNLPAAGPIPVGHKLVALSAGGRAVVQAPSGMPWVEPEAGSGAGSGPALWLAVPLCHAGQLSGFTLLAPPRAPFALDGEVSALLHTVGQEVASFIAEQRAAEALLQTRQLREYGQRFAFVAHDIKNVASQLSLLLDNAEHHIANPAFQRDMLGTVGASVSKITTLLARLKAPSEAPEAPPEALQPTPHPWDMAAHLRSVAAASSPPRRARIQLDLDGPAPVAMPAAAFDAVAAHLLDNAFEAAANASPVRVRCRVQGHQVLIDITDQGHGMTPEFIRERLFKPFSSSKRDGFGIGAYQARELLRQAGGDIAVTSAPGRGTTMRLSLPLAAAPALQAAG